MPFVRQQSRVHLDGQLRVERKTFGPLHQLVDYRVANLAEFVRQLGFRVQQLVQLKMTQKCCKRAKMNDWKLEIYLQGGNIFKLITINERANGGHGRLVRHTDGVPAGRDGAFQSSPQMEHLARIRQRRLENVAVGDPWHLLLLLLLLLARSAHHPVVVKLLELLLLLLLLLMVLLLLLIHDGNTGRGLSMDSVSAHHLLLLLDFAVGNGIGFENGLDAQCGGCGRYGRHTVGGGGSRRTFIVVLLVLPVFDLVEVVNSAGIPSAGHPVLPDGGQDHALGEALLEAAILAPIPLRLCDLAIAFRHASVHPLILHRPLEKAFAPVQK